MRPGIFIPCQAKHDRPRRWSPSLSRMAYTWRLSRERFYRAWTVGFLGARRDGTGGAQHRRAAAGPRWRLHDRRDFLLPFNCIGVPLLIVGLILAVAESGQVTRRASFPYPGDGPAYPYFQYPSMPPASPAPRPPEVDSTSPMPPPTLFCVSCGSALAVGAAFCARCGAPVQR